MKKSLAATVEEAALPMNTSYDALRGHIRSALMKHLGVESVWDSNGPWVVDIFEDNVIYDFEGQLYRQKYASAPGPAGSDPTVTFSGGAKKCHAAYMDSSAEATESVIITLQSDLTRVTESGDSVMCLTVEEFATVKESTKVPIKIIGPGWGSSAFYSKEVLMRDGPKVFTKGTHMYWNHATPTEEAERPEGDLDDLAAVLVSNAVWQEAGPKGAGLYSTAKVFSDYAGQVSEKGPHIGVSINAGIKGHAGEAEGRSGIIADQFVIAYSTDFVTKAGAGGAPIVPVLESRREETIMNEQEIKALQDRVTAMEVTVRTLEADKVKLTADNAALVHGQNVVVAVSTVGTVLKESGIPFSHRALELACQNPVIKEGKLDQTWLETVTKAFSEGMTGTVTGMGSRGGTPQAELDEKLKKSMEAAMRNLGVPEAGLKYAVEGRV